MVHEELEELERKLVVFGKGLLAVMAEVVVLGQLVQEDVVGQTAVGVALGFGGQVLVLGFVDHDTRHLGEVDKSRDLLCAQVVEAIYVVLVILFGDSQLDRVGMDCIDGLQHLGAEKMTA